MHVAIKLTFAARAVLLYALRINYLLAALVDD